MLGSLFLNPWMLLGAAGIAIPIAIHLFHRYRYKQVRWAAMEFLLDSQKKNRRRITLEQLLLLALRCLLILGIVAIIARPIGSEGFAALLGRQPQTEHWIVLDDSMSMSQTRGATDCYQIGIKAVEQIIEGLAGRPGAHRVTLLRTSRFHTPDLLATQIDEAYVPRFRSMIDGWKAGYQATSPAAAIQRAAELIGKSDFSNRTVHLISDFRMKDWAPDGALAAAVKSLGDTRAEIHLVDTASSEGTNLTLAAIGGQLGAAAARVPFNLEGKIRNQGKETLGPLAVALAVEGRPIPAQSLEPIPGGADASATFTLEIHEPGDHPVTMKLPEDSLLGDNHRYAVISLPERLPVLIIDASPKRSDSLFVSLALAPGGSVQTGLEPIVRGPEFLSNAKFEDYRAVLLLDVPRIERPVAEALLRYAQSGGGVGIFLGENVQPEPYNSLAGSQERLFPSKLNAVQTVEPVAANANLRFEASHPIFRIFGGEQNPFIGAVRLSKYYALADEKPSPPTVVIANTQAGDPLVLETPIGHGRVVTFLTTAGPAWNNWGRNPSYVVVMLELVRHLAQSAVTPAETLVGSPLSIEFPMKDHRREVRILFPQRNEEVGDVELLAEADGNRYRAELASADTPGIYTAVITGPGGVERQIRRAVNIDPAEGALQKVPRASIEQALPSLKFRYDEATEMDVVAEGGTFEPRDSLLLVFLLLLFAEQLFALRLSYHLRP